MTTLPPTTKSRLIKIAQVPGVWEGDRRPLGNMAFHLDNDQNADEECVIWVDGSEGAVRAMDVVSEETGIEAIARTLLRAIESPHHPGQPHRPQKIIVRDRELQFFLRGVLQDLEINIEYSPQLPLIDRLFEGFSEMDDSQLSTLPKLYEEPIKEVADKIWQNSPWELLADSDIVQIEFKDCEIEQVYLCVMGMMSAEYGVLLYRSLDSLKNFRSAALGENKSAAELERAFLAQDCWFLNYEEVELEEEDLLNITQIEPFFGSLHPFEGMRPFLDEEEAKIVYIALESLLRFCRNNRQALETEPIKAISKSYRISLPEFAKDKKTISTTVSTLPELAEELLNLGTSDRDQTQEIDIPIQEDLIPDGALISLASISGELIEQAKHQSKTYYQSLGIVSKGKTLPTIFIQTTRPKAKELITKIHAAGGLKAVCFNPGNDPFSGEIYDLGMLQTGSDELFIFAEYSHDVAQQVKALEKWHQRCQQTKGYCSLVIAMGVTGVNRGNPQAKDILALFELKSIKGSELGMGVLQLMPNFEL
ncbi:DUF6930 domain-containing protein [Pleurocapsa sp. FMAR1]|uniref:DUF6930 domain-containing protein n=1 Tax=Pleurocapsa sp. FMAR1 TaxID=3040204 RepID=UPI0029C8B78F|nr:hypothetical protein [Pleurocapsa sp. FMAR1]